MAAKSKTDGPLKRRRYKGKTVQPTGAPRSHTSGGSSQAASGWTMGDTAMKEVPTKHVLGRFRATAPTKRAHRRGFYRSAA